MARKHAKKPTVAKSSDTTVFAGDEGTLGIGIANSDPRSSSPRTTRRRGMKGVLLACGILAVGGAAALNWEAVRARGGRNRSCAPACPDPAWTTSIMTPTAACRLRKTPKMVSVVHTERQLALTRLKSPRAFPPPARAPAAAPPGPAQP